MFTFRTVFKQYLSLTITFSPYITIERSYQHQDYLVRISPRKKQQSQIKEHELTVVVVFFFLYDIVDHMGNKWCAKKFAKLPNLSV